MTSRLHAMVLDLHGMLINLPRRNHFGALDQCIEKAVTKLYELDAAVQAIASIREADVGRLSWQPIATAPEGVEVDVWANTPSEPMRYERAWFEKGLWWFTTGGESWETDSLPKGSVTHWMPLPEPPAALSDTQGV